MAKVFKIMKQIPCLMVRQADESWIERTQPYNQCNGDVPHVPWQIDTRSVTLEGSKTTDTE